MVLQSLWQSIFKSYSFFHFFFNLHWLQILHLCLRFSHTKIFQVSLNSPLYPLPNKEKLKWNNLKSKHLSSLLGKYCCSSWIMRNSLLHTHLVFNAITSLSLWTLAFQLYHSFKAIPGQIKKSVRSPLFGRDHQTVLTRFHFLTADTVFAYPLHKLPQQGKH